MVTPQTRLAIHRVHVHFVAEVTRIDRSQAISREDFRAIRDASSVMIHVGKEGNRLPFDHSAIQHRAPPKKDCP